MAVTFRKGGDNRQTARAAVLIGQRDNLKPELVICPTRTDIEEPETKTIVSMQ
jgi:hypothetical protein